MAFCQTCGAQVEGRFCAKCGSPVQAAPSGPPPPAGAPPASSYQQQASQQQYAPAATGMSDNTASGLAYLVGFITGIIFLVIEPYNKSRTVRFHAFQSIFLSVAWFALWIVASIVFSIIGLFSLVLGPLLWLAFMVLWLYVMISAFQGKQVVLPVIGPLAQQQVK